MAGVNPATGWHGYYNWQIVALNPVEEGSATVKTGILCGKETRGWLKGIASYVQGKSGNGRKGIKRRKKEEEEEKEEGTPGDANTAQVSPTDFQ